MRTKLLAMGLALALLLALAFSGLWLKGITPPADLPNWITAGATAFALVFAALAALATYGQLTVLKDEAKKRALELRSTQARLVYWSEEGGFKWFNVSDEPVLNASVLISAPGGDSCVFRFGQVNPTGREGESVPVVDLTVKEVVKRWAFQEHQQDRVIKAMFGGHPYSSTLFFTDAAGFGWMRDASGRLREANPDGKWSDFVDHAAFPSDARSDRAKGNLVGLVNKMLDEGDGSEPGPLPMVIMHLGSVKTT